MRKISLLMLAILLSAAFSLQAQTVSTFDDLTLQPDSFWNGSDLSGGFINQGVYFINYYDTSYGGFWNGGFAYSNKTDSVTAGYTNEYSVMAGYAYSGTNFAVANPGSFNTTYIKLLVVEDVTGFFVTNSTYAYISMRDGDAYAKKFGGTTGDDPDWFKLTVDGYNNGTLTDSAGFYLADFRFSDNSQDYILKDWTWFDLSALGNIDSLVFRLSSSDVGQYGINTPAFFCMDDFSVNPTGVKTVEDQVNLNVFPNPVSDVLIIQSESIMSSVELISLQGNLLRKVNPHTHQLALDIKSFPSGIYLLRMQTVNGLFLRKIIKN